MMLRGDVSKLWIYYLDNELQDLMAKGVSETKIPGISYTLDKHALTILTRINNHSWS